MTQSNASDTSNLKEAKLPRRDWILLPALSLLTICILVVSTDFIVLRMFPESETSVVSCLIKSDLYIGGRGNSGMRILGEDHGRSTSGIPHEWRWIPGRN